MPIKPSDKTQRLNQHSVSQLGLAINFSLTLVHPILMAVRAKNRPARLEIPPDGAIVISCNMHRSCTFVRPRYVSISY